MRTEPTAKDIDSTIEENLPKLRLPGVLTVRPGFEITNHQLTGRSAIVATVHTKKPADSLSTRERLPEKIGGVPVDVREATAYQRLRAVDPASAEIFHAHARPEDKMPVWSLERELPSGELLTSARSRTQKTQRAQTAAVKSTTSTLDAHATKKKVDYTPTNVPALKSFVVDGSKFTVAVSPDAGFATLSKFLDGTTKSLVVGMYDFTSAPILATFKSVLKSPISLKMVLDRPAPNETSDQTDWQTVTELKADLGDRGEFVWALAGDNPFVTGKIAATSYHIKVIVRDEQTLWLSSGNLNNSNEPDLSNPRFTMDRDWHVVIDDAELAKLFSAYIDYDYVTALKCQAPQSQDQEIVTKAIQAANEKAARQTNPPKPPNFSNLSSPPLKGKSFGKSIGNVTVTPLLTPDTVPDHPDQGWYLTRVTALLQAAKKSIDIQLQYIEASKPVEAEYQALLQVLRDKADNGVKVRLIVGADDAEKWGEKMKDPSTKGVDLTDLIYQQPKVHNKGFVIDSSIVIVSSQNFSPDGVQFNRDAGVIMENAEIAKYFGAVFQDDWSKRAKPLVVKAARPVSKKTAAGKKAVATKKPVAAKKTAAASKKPAKKKIVAAKKATRRGT